MDRSPNSGNPDGEGIVIPGGKGWDEVAKLANKISPDSQGLDNQDSNGSDRKDNESSEELSMEPFLQDGHDDYGYYPHREYSPEISERDKMVEELSKTEPINARIFAEYCTGTGVSIERVVNAFAAEVQDSAGISDQRGVDACVDGIDKALKNYYESVADNVVRVLDSHYSHEKPQHNDGRVNDPNSALQETINKKKQSIADCISGVLELLQGVSEVSLDIKDGLETFAGLDHDKNLFSRINDYLQSNNDEVKRSYLKDICHGIQSERNDLRTLGKLLHNAGFLNGKDIDAEIFSDNIKSSRLFFVKGILGYAKGLEDGLNASPESSSPTNSEPSGSELEDGLNASPESSGSTNSVSGVPDLSTDDFV